MAPGVAERSIHTYVRDGITSLFAALDIAAGAVIGKCYWRLRTTEFLDLLKQIDRQMLEGPKCILSWTTAPSIRPEGSGRAGVPPASACALHPNFRLLDQPGQAFVAEHPICHPSVTIQPPALLFWRCIASGLLSRTTFCG